MQVATPNSSRVPSSSPRPNSAVMQICNMGRAVINQSFLVCSFLSHGAGAELPGLGAGQSGQGPLSLPEQIWTISYPLREPNLGSPPSQAPDLVFGVRHPPKPDGSGHSRGSFLDQPSCRNFLPGHQYAGCVVAQSRKADTVLKFVVSWLCFCFSSAFRDVLWVCISLSFHTLVSSARLTPPFCLCGAPVWSDSP